MFFLNKIRKFVFYLFFFIILFLKTLAFAEQDFLPPEVAFNFNAAMINSKTAEIEFKIAENYYIYRDRFKFESKTADLGQAKFPKGEIVFDETFNKKMEIYRGNLKILLPIKTSSKFILKVISQGCSDKGLCYTPMDSIIELLPYENNKYINPSLEKDNSFFDSKFKTDIFQIGKYLEKKSLIIVIPLFFFLGIGLSFTPCVLPMIPILLGIIIGNEKHLNRKKSILYSLSYSLGMAIVYTLLGIISGLIGEGLSAMLQSKELLIFFAFLIFLLSLSMFDFYQIQVPSSIQQKLGEISNNFRKRKIFGAFIMGAISALIIGPCVAAPLAGALVYISETKDVFVGGFALFSMATGMSIPLIFLAFSAGTFLPKVGIWMDSLKPFFGLLLLALSLWMLRTIIPPSILISGWGLLAISYGIYLFRLGFKGHIKNIFGVIFVCIGLLQFYQLKTTVEFTNFNFLKKEKIHKTNFLIVKNLDELKTFINASRGKNIMLDFYADWCISCDEMERLTFSNDKIRSKLEYLFLLQVDVTKNTIDDKELLKYFGLFGPPGIIFFDKNGNELKNLRVIGFQKAEDFLKTITKVVEK